MILPTGPFDLINADPPWPFATWSPKNQDKGKGVLAQYPTMSIDDIKAMPIGDIAAADCTLALWSVATRQQEALDTMRAWGFTPKSIVIWRKVTVNGKVRVGTGYLVRSMAEVVHIGTRGKPTKLSALPGIFDGLAREHSRKPDEWFSLLAKHMPGMSQLDLFSRESRPGWTTWGNEAGKFDLGAAA